MIPHALTIDVEDSYNILMYDLSGRRVSPTDAVVRNTTRLLDIVEEYNIRATFFFLGEVAQTFPTLVRRVADSGHEVGVHGYRHIQFFRMKREQALEELRRAKKIIEDITGQRARGHRAPAFSIRPDTAWGLETLAEAGFEYDSSIVPCKMERYGWPGFPRDINRIELPGGAHIVEAPITTVSFLGRETPACGGGYLCNFPLFFTRWAFRRMQRARPVIVYIHPYEIDIEPIPVEFRDFFKKMSLKKKLVMHAKRFNRRSVEKKLRALFATYSFVSLAEVIDRTLDKHSGCVTGEPSYLTYGSPPKTSSPVEGFAAPPQ